MNKPLFLNIRNRTTSDQNTIARAPLELVLEKDGTKEIKLQLNVNFVGFFSCFAPTWVNDAAPIFS